MTDKRRLIEVAFPLKQTSLASVHEKNVRHGHISTLHIWPARRPLAASRAALLATLLPDPEDPSKRQELLNQIGGKVVKKNVKETDDDGNTVVEEKEVVEGGVLAWGQENAPDISRFRASIRKSYGDAAPKVIDPFAGGGAIPLEAMRLGCDVTASELNPVACFILKCTLDYPQQFATKKWPLPDFVREWSDFIEDFVAGKVKKRKGKHTVHFSDPQQLGLTELPDADLTWHVRAWGRWVLERARADVATRYPAINGEPTVAYMWARTARDKMAGGRIPLLKTFWLCRKKGRRAALLPVPKADGTGVAFRLLHDADIDSPQRTISEYPFLESWEVTPNNFSEFLRSGSMNRAGVWSPISGRPGMIALTMEDLRQQGQQGLLSEQMTAVVVESVRPASTRTFKSYRLPHEREIEAADVQREELEAAFDKVPFGIPDELIPLGSSRRGGGSAFTVPLYGFKKWRDVFTPRQLLTFGAFIARIREAHSSITKLNPDIAEAVLAYLLCGFDRMLDFNSSLVAWILSVEAIGHTFARFALPMTWDYSEAAMVNGCRGGWTMCLDATLEAFITATKAWHKDVIPPHIEQSDAVKLHSSGFEVVITDPPYYGSIPYSDLMDFFYIWDRRLLDNLSGLADLFAAARSPKWDEEKQEGELIEDQFRNGGDKTKARQAYEDGMARAFQRALASLNDSGRMVVVFANKEVDAWEALIAALIRGGAVVTGSWPIQTEQAARMRAQSSAALASSVWIVCRKREVTAGVGWEERVTDRMKQILFDPRETLGDRNILQYYFDLGIRGPDFIWAALGPALEAYSAHPFVKKTGGGVMTVQEFLKEVRKIVLQFSLGELPGFRDMPLGTQGRGESLELDPVTQYYLLHRADFGLEPAPAGACILYANACGKNETELKVVWNILEQGGKIKRGRPRNDELEEESIDEGEAGEDAKGNEYRLLSWEERARRDGLGEMRGEQPAPLIDRLHRLMYLFQRNRASEVQQLFDKWALSNERAFKPLLQAVRELAHRDIQNAEQRLVEALATQLRMNRKMVMVANEMKEVDLFEAAENGNAAVQD